MADDGPGLLAAARADASFVPEDLSVILYGGAEKASFFFFFFFFFSPYSASAWMNLAGQGALTSGSALQRCLR